MRTAWRAAGIVVVALARASIANAQGAPTPEPVRVVYDAPGGCPTRAELESALGERLGSATLGSLDELARTLTVTVTGEPGAFRARVELVDREGNETSREVTAPTCEQAVEAIALVAALAVRSQAERKARTSHSEREPAEPAAAPQGTLGHRRPPVTPSRNTPPTSTASRNRTTVWEHEVAGGLSLATGVGPGVAPGVFVAGRLGVSGPMSRSVVLSGIFSDTLERDFSAASARFDVIKGRVELCPFELSLTRSLRLSPCPGFEVGAHSGKSYPDGERVAEASSASRIWLAASFSARLRLRTESLAVAVGPELVVPISKHRFALSRPERPVYEVPDVTVGAGASAGVVW